ncbi:MAG: hypothetical protein NTZ60_11195 [Campylobacterales bacterium]|nr:hypothetical protein [Campylobacterales bacterium]
MKYKLTQHAYDVITSREIHLQWIELTVDNADMYVVVSEIEVHFFKSIEEASNKCLKVVANPTNLKIITTYFDRDMRKKGCK